jgi:hypothetical protein
MIAANNKMSTIAGTVFEYAASIAAPASIISLTTGTMVETFPGCVFAQQETGEHSDQQKDKQRYRKLPTGG